MDTETDVEQTFWTDDAGKKHGRRWLKNGALYDYDVGRIVGLDPERAEVNTQITAENSSEYKRLLQEKTQRLLAAAIVTETADKLELPQMPTAPDAVAAAGAILWREIVLDPEQYARDRLEAFKTLGQLAQMLPGAGDRSGPAPVQQLNVIGADAAAALLPLLRQAQDRD